MNDSTVRILRGLLVPVIGVTGVIGVIAVMAVIAVSGEWTLAGPVQPDVTANVTTTFRFRHAFVDRNLPGSAWGQTDLGDVDGDGDLDFITGRRGGDVRWYEFQAGEPKKWRQQIIGKKSPSDVGGALLDVDRDGRLDFVAGGVWYRQPAGNPRQGPWKRFTFDGDLRAVHDLIVADLDGDGREDVVTMSDRNDLRWYSIPPAPEDRWLAHRIADPIHAGVAAGDLDRDGDNDLVRGVVWLENDGEGGTWQEHRFCSLKWSDEKRFPGAARSAVADLNRDGRTDIILTEGEMAGARVAWFEAPEDPRQESWRPHMLSNPEKEKRGPHHSLAVADFDLDGDLDVFSGEMESIGTAPHRWFLWENASGDGARFVEHVILDRGLGTHEAVAGDIDGDGDIDIAGKPWRAVSGNGNGGRNHVDFLENLQRGGDQGSGQK